MQVEKSVMGHTVVTSQGSIYLVPSAIGEDILKLQDALKVTKDSLAQRTDSVDRLATQLAESRAAYGHVVTEVGTLRARLGTPQATETTEADCKPAATTDLRTYMATTEAKAQRIELYKLVMKTLYNKTSSATLPELLELRNHLI